MKSSQSSQGRFIPSKLQPVAQPSENFSEGKHFEAATSFKEGYKGMIMTSDVSEKENIGNKESFQRIMIYLLGSILMLSCRTICL